MNYDTVCQAALTVYKECTIRSFPIDCFHILETYGLTSHPYSSLNEELRSYCINYSNDALNYKNLICYNDKQPVGRIRFSLMHELGHVILKHGENHTRSMEQEANFFASNILAPRIAIHYAKCNSIPEVAALFGLTKEAAGYAFEDYKRRHRYAMSKKLRPSEQTLYLHFYHEDAGAFIYSIKQCAYCDTPIYNSFDYICPNCKLALNNTPILPDHDLLVAENHWLYGGL